jgi:mRNA interferase HicA
MTRRFSFPPEQSRIGRKRINIDVAFYSNSVSSLRENAVKYSAFKRGLLRHGAELTRAPGGGSHYKVLIKGKRSLFPDHGAKEMPDPPRDPQRSGFELTQQES